MASMNAGKFPEPLSKLPQEEVVTRRTRRLCVGLLLPAILLISTALDLFFFTGFYASDDKSYYGAAEELVTEGYFVTPPDLGRSRLTIVGWNALVVTLCGLNAQAVAASYVLLHQLLNLLTFLLGRRLFDWRVGLLAAWATGTLSILVVFSTSILPDVPLACAWVAALYAFLRGLDARSGKRPATAYLWLLLAGVSVGIGYMAKESSLVLLPYFFVLWLVSEWRSPRRQAIARGAVFALGVGAVVVFETIVIAWLSDESYVRLGWTTEQPVAGVAAALARYGKDPLERLSWVVHRLTPDFVPPAFLWVVLGSVLLFPVVCRRRWALLFAGLWAFAYQTWGTMRLTEYQPPTIQTRYYIPMVPLFMIVLAAASITLVDWLWRRVLPRRLGRPIVAVAVAVAIAYPLTSLPGADRQAGKSYRADVVGAATRAIRGALEQEDRLVVLSPGISRTVGPLHPELWTSRVNLFSYEPAPELLSWTRWCYLKLDPALFGVRRKFTEPLDLIHVYPDLRQARYVWSLRPDVPDCVEVSGHRLLAGDVEVYRLPLSRTRDFASRHLGLLAGAPIAVDEGAREVWAVNVRLEPCEDSGSASENAEEIPLVRREWWIGGAETKMLVGDENGVLRLQWSDLSREAAWLVPVEGSTPTRIPVPPGTLATFVLEVENLEAPNAEFVVDAAPDGAGEAATTRHRISLGSGRNVIYIHATDEPLTCRPLLKMPKPGSLAVKRLAVQRRPASQFTDFQEWHRYYRSSVVPPEGEFRRGRYGELQLTVNLSRSANTWLTPNRIGARRLPELAPQTRYDFALETEIDDLVQVQFVVGEVAGASRAATGFEHRLTLLPGVTNFSVITGDRPIRIYPVYKVFGRGRFVVRSLAYWITE